jgi:hypothetical protein
MGKKKMTAEDVAKGFKEVDDKLDALDEALFNDVDEDLMTMALTTVVVSKKALILAEYFDIPAEMMSLNKKG